MTTPASVGPMIGGIDHVKHLEAESARFSAAIAAAPAGAVVPTCPEWTAEDLWWHLTRVQSFWGAIVAGRLEEPPAVDPGPARPADRSDLAALFAKVSGELVSILAATPPEEQVWTWHTDRSVAFIRRRQAHEALIHRVDAELITSGPGPIDPLLAADGVDEAIRVAHGFAPPGFRFTAATDQVIRIRATDTGDSWMVRPGRWSRPDAGDDQTGDLPGLEVIGRTTDPVGAELLGSAADLDCWLWNRPPNGPLDQIGDSRLHRLLAAVVEAGVA